MTLSMHPNFKQWILFALLLLMWIIMITSCSPAKRARRHLRIADRHIQKARALDSDVLPKNSSDTITIFSTDTTYLSRPLDTVWVYAPRDTVIQTIHKGDTIIIEKKGNNIGVFGAVREKIIRDTVEKIITKTNFIPKAIKPSNYTAAKQVWWLILIGYVLGLVTLLFKHVKN